MKMVVLAGSLALASLSIVPACVDEPGGEVELQLGAAEAALSSAACPDDTPAVLAPAADLHLYLVLDATGVQEYACTATATAFGAAWMFVGPAADLFTSCGDQVGTHYAGPGPTWEHEDGSTVVAASAASAIVDLSAIPWLSLSVTHHAGPAGKFSPAAAIQRLRTSGGRAPASGCDTDNLGAIAAVPYQAQYFFYRKRTYNQQYNTRCGAH